jgi:hypothetical protein
MATTYVGNEGGVTGGTVAAKINTWQATVSRVSHDITGFSDAGRVRKLGLYDITGSAGGLLESSASSPWSLLTNITGATITLAVLAHTTTSSASSINFNAVMNDVAMSSAKGGDAAVTFNFGLSASNTSIMTSVWQAT